MKTTYLSKWVAGLTGVVMLSGAVMGASQKNLEQSYAKILAAVPAAEMPAKAASLVTKAKPQERETNAVAAVRAAIKVSPVSTLATVGSICSAAPDTAPAVVAAAIKLQPSQARAIANVGTTAAPTQAAEITKATRAVTTALALTTAPTAAGAAPKAPTPGPPYTPGGGSPGEVNGGASVEIPPGGIRYSTP
jgi:hypothetical protein